MCAPFYLFILIFGHIEVNSVGLPLVELNSIHFAQWRRNGNVDNNRKIRSKSESVNLEREWRETKREKSSVCVEKERPETPERKFWHAAGWLAGWLLLRLLSNININTNTNIDNNSNSDSHSKSHSCTVDNHDHGIIIISVSIAGHYHHLRFRLRFTLQQLDDPLVIGGFDSSTWTTRYAIHNYVAFASHRTQTPCKWFPYSARI